MTKKELEEVNATMGRFCLIEETDAYKRIRLMASLPGNRLTQAQINHIKNFYWMPNCRCEITTDEMTLFKETP